MGVPGSAEALVVVVEVVQRVYYALVRSGGGGVATQLRYSVKDTKAGTNDALSCTMCSDGLVVFLTCVLCCTKRMHLGRWILSEESGSAYRWRNEYE